MIYYMYRTLKNHKITRINEFNKAAGYKINIQKLIVLLYTNNELSERETKKAITFTIASKKLKYKIYRNKSNLRGKRPILGKL